MARPTASTSLHVQMLGRGTRIAPGKRDALILDFAGNVQRLGPITAPRVHSSTQRGEVAGEASVKVCPRCDSYIERAVARCGHCGFVYDTPDRRVGDNFDEVDPLYARPLPVEGVAYAAHYKPGRPASLRITYSLPDRRLSEWLCLFHPGYAGEKARAEWSARGGGQVPGNINEAVRLAPAVLRRPPTVTINEVGGFEKPVPVWDHGWREWQGAVLPANAPEAR